MSVHLTKYSSWASEFQFRDRNASNGVSSGSYYYICIVIGWINFQFWQFSPIFPFLILFIFLTSVLNYRFHIDKRCQHRCSWKCFSFALIFVAVILAAMLAYFAGKCNYILIQLQSSIASVIFFLSSVIFLFFVNTQKCAFVFHFVRANSIFAAERN